MEGLRAVTFNIQRPAKDNGFKGHREDAGRGRKKRTSLKSQQESVYRGEGRSHSAQERGGAIAHSAVRSIKGDEQAYSIRERFRATPARSVSVAEKRIRWGG